MEDINFHIRLEARNPGRGHFRAYSIEAAQNLFGEWDIEVKFGRIGRRGRSVTYSAADDATAAAIARQCLHRRTTAPKRIGVPYQIKELVDPKEWASVTLQYESKILQLCYLIGEDDFRRRPSNRSVPVS